MMQCQKLTVEVQLPPRQKQDVKGEINNNGNLKTQSETGKYGWATQGWEFEICDLSFQSPGTHELEYSF